MITLLSPAKKLLHVEKPCSYSSFLPIFTDKTRDLVRVMQSKSSQDIAKLMHLSQELADLNYHRYQNFSILEKYPAIFLFQGDVYRGLEAETWNKESLDFAQSHLMILSGLYGLLKPLDVIQPYRLEMGTRLKTSSGNNLYEYWQTMVTQYLTQVLSHAANPILINLASSEYFKVVDCKMLQYPVIHIHFMEQKDGQLRVIGIYAKKARGAMARFIMQHQLDELDSIKQFDGLNYHFSNPHSDDHNLVFIRNH